ncbi:MAG: glutaredoxin [Treponema sp.]|jgi:arsenate reductase-like glutaredoxin family protein|nr:glutaredoxin [Treponema sp.]
MIQIFGTRKCKDTQKVLRFFKERSIDVQFRDVDIKAPSPGELDDMASSAGAAALIDEEGAFAKKMGLSYMDFDAKEELLLHPELYKTPLIRPGKGQVLIGFDEKALKNLLKDNK